MTAARERLVYADSSALVKLVVTEGESDALARELARLPTTLVTSRIALIEATRAVRLADPEQVSEADILLASCSLVTVSDVIIGIARTLASIRIRTLDAIHLATAMHVGADAIAVYDSRLAVAATEMGLHVLAPTA